MKNIAIGIIIIFVGVSIFEIFQTGKPTIYVDVQYDRTQLGDAIEDLKVTTRFERVIALSDSPIAKIIKIVSPKINQIHYNYYYVIDYCIEHYQKHKVDWPSNERNSFKKNKNSWNLLKSASFPGNQRVSQDYRVNELNRVKTDIFKSE